MNVDVKKLTVGELLRDGKNYMVPVFQRSFAWEKEQITHFWNDLNEIIVSEDEKLSHFLGTMVFTLQDDEFYNILDGQQRFACFLLFVAALRDILVSTNYAERMERINVMNNYLYTTDPISLEKNSKLFLNQEDDEYFQKLTIERISKISKIKSHKLIIEAYNFFFTELRKKIHEEEQVYIKKILTALLEKCIIIRIEVDSDSNAHMLFETLNDRGLDLTVADLVKNYLLSINKDEIESMFEQWKKIADNVGDHNVTKFLRHFWISSEELVRKDKLYQKLKDKVDSQNVVSFMNNLEEESQVYSNLRRPTHEFWENEEIENYLEELRTLRVEVVYSLLLAIYSKYFQEDKRTFKELLKIVVSFSFRFHTICKFNPNMTERLYGEISSKIRKGEVDKEELVEKLFELNPTSPNFKEFFAEFETKTPKIAKNILIAVNNYLLSKDGKDEITTNIRRVNLEHIIPQKPDKEWKEYFDENSIKEDELIHKIGNMTILLKEYNASITNKYFTKKQATYNKSELPLNDILTEYDEFGPEQVEERQKFIGEIVDEIWSV